MKRKEKSFSPSKLGMPSFKDTLNNFEKQSLSEYPLRLLGTGYKDLYMMEEEREVNFHIIGGSRQGKSKYLEYHIRRDIDLGFGLCLIDPSDFGATFNAVLDYCASIGHEKVCVIDPNTLYDYGSVACIQPLNPDYPTKSAHSVKDSINMLLGTSEANTQRIQENLDALLRMLASEGLTLYETGYFVDYEARAWEPILNKAKGKDAQIIREKFGTYGYWKSEFTTTVTRLGKIRNEPLSLMIAGQPGINFRQMVDDGWVILCNLFPAPYLKPEESTFLGILIISQIIQAIDELNRGGKWGKKFYLYIDEAGSFATPQIQLLLDNKSKSGLHLVFAHHHFDQFEGQNKVLSSIMHNTGIKVMFAVREPSHRLKMLHSMNFENPREASHTYGNLPKQHAVIKKNKEYPMEVVTPTIESVEMTAAERESYIRELLKQPWYLAKYEIERQIQSRGVYPPALIQGTVPDRQTVKHPPATRPKSLLDLGADALKLIRHNQTAQPDGEKETD